MQHRLSQHEIDELIQLLESCSALQDPRLRTQIIRRLPNTLRPHIPELPTLRAQVTAMVQTCNAFPTGLNDLLVAVEWFEGDSHTVGAVRKYLFEETAAKRPQSAAGRGQLRAPRAADRHTNKFVCEYTSSGLLMRGVALAGAICVRCPYLSSFGTVPVPMQHRLSQHEIDELIQLLESCSALQDPRLRTQIIRRLPNTLRPHIPELPTLRAQVTAMVQTCNAFPTGLNDLLVAVEWFEGDSHTVGAVRKYLFEETAAKRPQSAAGRGQLRAPRAADRHTNKFVWANWRGNRVTFAIASAVTVCAVAIGGYWITKSQSRRSSAQTMTYRPGANKASIQVDEQEPRVGSVVEVPNSAPIRFIRLPRGSFTMGSPADELERDDDERQHQVAVSSFELADREITHAQWRAIMEPELERADQDIDIEADLPVQNVSWVEATEFMNRLSVLDGLRPCYERSDGQIRWDRGCDGYRLPTEAEWEYACRAGSRGAYSFGDNADILGDHAWYGEGESGRAHGVGLKRPNAWGFYDMHGNVWEWVWDWYGAYPAHSIDRVVLDPQGPDEVDATSVRVSLPSRQGSPFVTFKGKVRGLRGGSFWIVPTMGLRCANRFGMRPQDKVLDAGVRPARSLGQPVEIREFRVGGAQERDARERMLNGPSLQGVHGGISCLQGSVSPRVSVRRPNGERQAAEIENFAEDGVFATVWDEQLGASRTRALSIAEVTGLTWSDHACDERGCREDTRCRIKQVQSSGPTTADITLRSNAMGWTYEMEYSDVQEGKSLDWRPVCDGGSSTGLFVNGHWGADGRWYASGYTFSCSSGAIAKCARGWGYKPWGAERHGLLLQRLHQACVRAVRADYCGDGRSHTRRGVLVQLFDDYGINRREDFMAGATEEAVFTAHGAHAVQRPRLATRAVACAPGDARTDSRDTEEPRLQVWSVPPDRPYAASGANDSP